MTEIWDFDCAGAQLAAVEHIPTGQVSKVFGRSPHPSEPVQARATGACCEGDWDIADGRSWDHAPGVDTAYQKAAMQTVTANFDALRTALRVHSWVARRFALLL